MQPAPDLQHLIWTTPLPLFVDLDITVYAKPRTKGSKIVGKHGSMREVAKHLDWWMEAVRDTAAKQWGDAPALTGPCALVLLLTMSKPKELIKKKNVRLTTIEPRLTRRKIGGITELKWWPIAGRDSDKMDRGVRDALAEAGIYRNDAQVTDTATRKRYEQDPEPGVLARPGARIIVWALK